MIMKKEKYKFYWQQETINNKDSKGRTDVSATGFYNRKEWQHTRSYYAYINPFCERCLNKDKGIIRKVDEVHHIRPLSLDDISNNDVERLYSESNLMSLCYQCHKIVHKEIDKIDYDLFDRMNTIGNKK